MIGVTSMCRFWLQGESVYNSLLHFFRSKAYCYADLLNSWNRFVLQQNKAIEIDGRCVLLGDHTHIVKDGRRMPGVVSMRETSETQSRPSYFRGQCWGAIGLLVGSLSACFCLPLQLQIHQGFCHIGLDKQEGETNYPSMAQRLILMAVAFSVRYDRPSILVLDAYFPVASVFRLARSIYSIALKAPYLEILVRAKKNYVAYFPAEPKPKNRPGPQKRYGDKVHLMECFDHLHLFQTLPCEVYGQTESIQIMTMKLLWRPIGDWILFVFAITSRGPIILMCSDLQYSPTRALELYCARTRIEIMFDVLKHLIGAFCFRFWSKQMPKHSRRPVSNKYLKKPQPEHLATVEDCWQAYERFVLCAMIAQGLLQLIALKFGKTVWQKHTLYLRTQSRELPSEKTVKQVFAAIFNQQLFDLQQNGIIQKIRLQFMAISRDKEDEDD